MAFVPITNGVAVNVRGTLDDEAWDMTLYYTYPGSFGTSEMQALADAIDAYWGPFVSTYLEATAEYVETVVRDMRTAIASEVSANTEATAGGNTGGTDVPNNVAIAVARRSAYIGRSARGRVFVPVSSSLNLDASNNISSTFKTAVETVLTNIDSAASAIDWTGVIVSRVQGGVPLSTAIVYTIVEWLVVNTVVDSMRRRLPGRGA